MLRPQDPLRNHWTSIKNFFVDAPLILPKLVRPSVRHSRADVRFAYVLVLLFLGSSFDTAHAWNAYNNTQFDVNFKVRNIPGDDICTPWTAEEGVIIEAGENTTSEFRSNPAPSWKSENCNPTGERDARLDFVILGRQDNDASATDLSEKKGRFRCDVKGNAGGWVTVYEQPRPGFDDNGNIRPNIYCVSFYKKDNGQQVVIDRSDAFAASRVDLLDPMTLGNRDIRFLITGDPQYWEKDGTTDNIGVNKTADKLLDRMLSIYENSHLRTRGIIISGDLTQDSKNNELTKYKNKIEKSGFRITTTRVYEGLGNHDSVGGTVAGDAIPEEIAKYVGQKARNTFPTSRNLEGHDTFPNYSWEWHDVHFVQLNLFPGDNPGVDPSGNDIEPNNALTFLKDDLANNVGSTNRPIILIHHYGFDSFGLQWWSTDQREAYWNAIKDYNVIAIFVGHAHLTTDTDHDDDWYGTGTELDKPSNADARADGRTEIPVFNAAAARGG